VSETKYHADFVPQNTHAWQEVNGYARHALRVSPRPSTTEPDGRIRPGISEQQYEHVYAHYPSTPLLQTPCYAGRVACANARRTRSLTPSAKMAASVATRGAKAARLSHEHTRRRGANLSR